MRSNTKAIANRIRRKFQFQLNKIPPDIRNMTLKKFSEKYQGEMANVLTSESRKMQKELAEWVAATPRLRSSAKDAANKARSRYNLRSSRKPTRRSARIANKRASRTARDATPMIRQTGRRTRATTSKRQRTERKKKRTHSRDIDINDENDSNKENITGPDLSIICGGKRLDSSALEKMTASQKRKMKADLQKHLSTVASLMDAITEE
eukprot:jgi/Bigna1/82133/fgenesh1_pg.88_\